MAHPLSGDAVEGAAIESGYAEVREVQKKQKHNQQLSQSGSRPSLIPLVF